MNRNLLPLLSLFLLLSWPGEGSAMRKVLYPGITVDPKGDVVANGLAVLRGEIAAEGLDVSDLVVDDVRESLTAYHVRFLQHYRGIPVWEGYLSVHYTKEGVVQLVENRARPGLDLPVRPRIGAAQARTIAAEAIGIEREERGEPTIALYIDAPEGGTPRLVWNVFWPTREPLGDWRLFIDAQTGRLLAQWNEIFYDRGYVYDPNAVQDTNDTSFQDNGNADSPALTDARSLVTLRGLSGNQLTGPFVDLCAPAVSGAYKPACQAADPDGTPPYEFDFTRGDDRFEEVVVYYAIDSLQRYIQETLGFDDVNNRPISAHAHYYGADNSFYSPSNKALHFGDGGVDDSEDADVILHEYGHAIHDDQVPGWGPGYTTEQRAIGEGFSDFLAGMFYLDHGSTIYQNTNDKWAA
ncbi:MAG: hypothetical protein D6812_15385, partial [Deltaproteobacteria bacterium]